MIRIPLEVEPEFRMFLEHMQKVLKKRSIKDTIITCCDIAGVVMENIHQLQNTGLEKEIKEKVENELWEQWFDGISPGRQMAFFQLIKMKLEEQGRKVNTTL